MLDPSLKTVYLEQQQPAAFDAEKRKTIDKSYKVSKANLLDIENSFGKVQVNTWSKNEMRVKVDVIARAASDSKAQEILDNIRIVEFREGDAISFKTEMSPMRINGNTQKSFEVNYTVFMPSENPLAVKNTYGDVYLADLQGKADITVKYGTLKSERLSNSGNNVKLTYGSGSCGFINGGNIQVAYADFNLSGTNGLQGSSRYSDFKIGSLGEELNLEVKYGSFKVDKVSKGIRRISLDSGFTPIALNFEDNTTFRFDVSVQFGDFKVDKSLINITSSDKDYTSAEYKGNFGGATSKGLVTITSKYGDVKFTQ
ncbi:hypothetical protein I2I11_08565 [Pontibacter sp. 172403-2]|nr:hypothetical protein [Pontibacter sp. 172403-2]